MYTALIAVAVLASLGSGPLAYAERSTVMWFGGTFAATSFANETANDPSINGGARFALTFEDAPLTTPGTNLFDFDTRLVPELFAGFYTNDTRIRGQLGAGLRAEIQLARGRSGDGFMKSPMRLAMYLAVRAKLSGPESKPGGEFMVGEYVIAKSGTRFGYEGGLGVVKRDDLDPARSPELEAIATVFVAR